MATQTKMFPKKASTLPSAKINYHGNFFTEPKELTKLLGEEYGRIRLRKRPCHPKNESNKQNRSKVLELKLLLARQRKTGPFLMTDLEKVLKRLKPKKA